MEPHATERRGSFWSHFGTLVRRMDPLPHGCPASSNVTPFGEEAFTTGVMNLHGGTCVMIITEKGIYNSHFRDGPSFSQSTILIREPVIFENDVLHPLKHGLHFLTSDGTFLEGPPACNPIIKDEDEPVAFIFGPRERNSQSMQYPVQIVDIARALRDVLPSVRVNVVGYVNVGQGNPVPGDSDHVDPSCGDIGQLEGTVVADYQPRVRMQDGREGSAVDIWIGEEEGAFRKEWASGELVELGFCACCK
ncbi:hypothetical protein ANOM_003453 [Aspergillus nomiae NRRL 13137]|uniref:Uncharacterized protein n=1 Tax=Aspergillus nomiae NRRL (strain ATCC 15546 / NRRL 13137 / CBS 260.88 / M93) TaxID=1509407 RepID=A0A0L1JBK6_ASPN3|nr:uncharacterized protein ANOM_003453 [Aspergillus nomiae NRRL 13137]KNG89095.1 hypothetical protein ANOM_003453 [Aspergillus nomiae NRRL 13137]